MLRACAIGSVERAGDLLPWRLPDTLAACSIVGAGWAFLARAAQTGRWARGGEVDETKHDEKETRVPADLVTEPHETAGNAPEPNAPWAAAPPRETTGASENARLAEVYGENYQKGYDDDGKVVSAPTDDSHFTSTRLYSGDYQTSHPMWAPPRTEQHDSRKATDIPGQPPRPDDGAIYSPWSTDEKDLTSYRPEELQKKFALSKPPTHLVDRHHPAGQELTHSVAGKNEYGPGGGSQIERRGDREGERNTPNADWNQKKDDWDLRPSGRFNRASNPRDYRLPERRTDAIEVPTEQQFWNRTRADDPSQAAEPAADQKGGPHPSYGEERLARSRSDQSSESRETEQEKSKDRDDLEPGK